MSLARATLLHEWRRFLPGLLSVAFAGVLMLVQLGLLLGMFGTVTVLVDRSDANLWVTSPETESFDQSRDIPANLGALLRLHPAVARSETLLVHDADWRSGDDTRVAVTLVGLTPAADALACPQPMRAALCAKLAEPSAVVIDRGEADKLHTAVGRLAEVNGHRVRVVGLSEGLRSIGNTYVFASSQTARYLSEPSATGEDLTTFVLAKARSDAPEAVRDDLQALLHRPAYRIWTDREFSYNSQRWWLTESGVGAGFLFSSLLGLIIGTVITSQTLRGVILSTLREYATFRAIGVPAVKLSAVVLEQSLWIGVLGALLTVLVSVLANALAQALYVPLVLTWWAVLTAVLIGLFTAVISGLLALRELYRLEPAELLR
ncbi:MAG: ABC transporter permease [Nevskiales bacterium]